MFQVELLRLEEADRRYTRSAADRSGHQGDARRKHRCRCRANLDGGELRPFCVKSQVEKITNEFQSSSDKDRIALYH